jgi:hypothetical protein
VGLARRWRLLEVAMAAQDSVGAAREALTTLAAAVLRLRGEYGDTLGVRRLTSDVDRLAEALDQLGEPQPGHRPGVGDTEMIVVPDDPYDESMWHEAESETQRAQ